jgi:hypothetical protein
MQIQGQTLRIRAVAPQDGEKSSVTLLIAVRVATSFYESGMREYRILHEIHAADSKGERRAGFDDFLRHAVPAANNLSFALEVHLKVLQAQRTGHYPHGHRIGVLYEVLADPLKASLQRRLIDELRRDPGPYLTDFTLQFGETEKPGSFQFRLNCVDENPPDLNDPNLFATEVAACDRLYLRWRYLYERGVASDLLAVRFISLIHMNRAIAAEIASYTGGVVIDGQGD